MNIRRFFLKYQNTFLNFILRKELKHCRTVLDVGCGHSSALGSIRNMFRSEGIDIHKKTIMESKRKRNHDTYRIGDISKLRKIYKEKRFDACVSMDVVEHFTKKDALKLIKNMEAVARKKVIILTPNGFYEQHDYDGNPHQVHKSGWSKKDFKKLGYKVYGLRGLKFLKDDHASIRFKPWIFWGFISFISEIVFFLFPSLSFDLFAVKDL